MHLLYARFWTKALHDDGLLGFTEPFTRLRNQGMMLTYTPGRDVAPEDGEAVIEDWKVLRPEERVSLPEEQWVWRWVKMSKSYGNVVTPDEVARQYGADALRVYELFTTPFEETVQWSDEGIRGAAKFLNRLWRLVTRFADGFSTERWKAQIGDLTGPERDLHRKTHQTIQKVTEDIEHFRFNTAVAALMEWVNVMQEAARALPAGERSAALDEAVEHLILLLAPIAPHLADELWEAIGKQGFLYRHPWPAVDIGATREAEVTLVVQINGKLRDKFTIPAGMDAEEVKRQAMARPKITAAMQNRTPKEVIVVPGRLVNIVL